MTTTVKDQKEETGVPGWKETLEGDIRLRLLQELFAHMIEDEKKDPESWLDGKFAICKWDIPEAKAEKELEQFKYRISLQFRQPIGNFLRQENTRATAFKILVEMAKQIGFEVGSGTSQIRVDGKWTLGTFKLVTSWNPKKLPPTKGPSKATRLLLQRTDPKKKKKRSPSLRLNINKKYII